MKVRCLDEGDPEGLGFSFKFYTAGVRQTTAFVGQTKTLFSMEYIACVCPGPRSNCFALTAIGIAMYVTFAPHTR